VVFLDVRLPGMDGLRALAELKARAPAAAVVVITAHGNLNTAVKAVEGGAFDYLAKPFDLAQAMDAARRAVAPRDAGPAPELPPEEPEAGPDALVGRSPAMQGVFKRIALVAPTEACVLITGESGTGKELVATALHRHSDRPNGPFVRVNCGALPESLIESELFGHERGAFTGADRQKPGRFERAAGGTIFLDEVGELPLSAQAKILRVLQQREFERVGGTETLRTDARVVSATHRDLAREVSAGRFREDLYYRLNVARIVIPPIRDRPEDIGPLAEHILKRLERRHGWGLLTLSPEALRTIQERTWPGNVRQLENTMARAAIAARGRTILPEHLDVEETLDPAMPAAGDSAEPIPLRALLADVERRAIQRALIACQGNRTKTAERLGISRRQLFDKIREYDLHP
jgi:two-component system response regulator AtoC